MTIVKLDMEQYLGNGVRLFLKDGRSMNFKVQGFRQNLLDEDLDRWFGYDDEGNKHFIRRSDIEFVR